MRDSAEKEEFMQRYVTLPPEERVRLWQTANDWKNRKTVLPRALADMDDALIVAGMDAVPYIAAVVRSGKKYHHVNAVLTLCEMDRFVPKHQLLIPEWGDLYTVKPLNLSGLTNRYMMVDGRRIGKTGYDVVLWAANQTKDKELQFHARRCSGILEQDYRSLSLTEQLRLWKGLAITGMSRGPHEKDPKDLHREFYLTRAIFSRPVEEFLPALVTMLETERNPHLRTALVLTIASVESKMRLRATDIGRKAIEAIRKACEQGHLKDFGQDVDTQKLWADMSQGFFDDEVKVAPFTGWGLMAEAFRKFHDGPLARQFNPHAGNGEPTPEFREFISYLTRVDPHFPVNSCRAGDKGEVLRPDFRKMTARCYEQWQRFQTSKTAKTQPIP